MTICYSAYKNSAHPDWSYRHECCKARNEIKINHVRHFSIFNLTLKPTKEKKIDHQLDKISK